MNKYLSVQVKKLKTCMENTTISKEEKKECLYREVKFVKTSATCINKPSALFRFEQISNCFKLKTMHKNNAHNLKHYFSCISSVRTIPL